MKIPNIFHMCFGFSDDPAKRRFEFVHYLAIRTAWQVNRPEAIHFYYKHAPSGYWWQQARRYVREMRVEPPTSIFGNPLRHYAHQADVFRLQTLVEHGGIYVDIDVVCLRDFSPLRDHECVMGIELPANGLCNAVILAAQGSHFLQSWLEEYRSFRSRGRDEFWGEHSVLVPARLAQQLPAHIHVEEQCSFFFPGHPQPELLWSQSPVDFSDSYCIHLWENLWQDYLRDVTPRYLRKSESNFARLFRDYGHGFSRIGEATEAVRSRVRRLLSLRRRLRVRQWLQDAFIHGHAWVTFPAYRHKIAEKPVVVDVGSVGHDRRRWLPGWGGQVEIRSLDLFGDADIREDATTLAQVADNSLDGIYTSHLIEHVWWWKTEDMLGAWFDKLKQGGRIEIRCPDFEWIFKKALRGGRHRHVWEDVLLSATYGSAVLPWSKHADDPGQYHRNLLWGSRLLEMLRRVGFVKVRRIRYWRPGYDRWPYDLKYRAEHGRHIVRDLVVEAYKPHQGQQRRVHGKTRAALQGVFSGIYHRNVWGGRRPARVDQPFNSGPGSDDEVTGEYREFVTRFIAERNIGSVVDIGCGDFRVGRHIAASGVDYVGVDVVPALIDYNEKHHVAPNVRFVCQDAVSQQPPVGELCLVRQVLQHLSNRDIKSVLRNVRGFRYALVTEHYPADNPKTANIDIMSGAGTRVDIGSAVVLDAPPFNARTTLVLQTALPNGEWLKTFLVEPQPVAGA